MPDDNPDVADDPEKDQQRLHDPGDAFGDPTHLPSVLPSEKEENVEPAPKIKSGNLGPDLGPDVKE